MDYSMGYGMSREVLSSHFLHTPLLTLMLKPLQHFRSDVRTLWLKDARFQALFAIYGYTSQACLLHQIHLVSLHTKRTSGTRPSAAPTCSSCIIHGDSCRWRSEAADWNSLEMRCNDKVRYLSLCKVNKQLPPLPNRSPHLWRCRVSEDFRPILSPLISSMRELHK